MEYIDFGNTGLKLSRLGFGPMRLPMITLKDDTFVDLDKAVEMIRHAIDNGVNYLDGRLYGIGRGDIQHLVSFDPALGIKITFRRPIDSGTVGDTDVYGAQQHAPLLGVLIPAEE